MHRLWQTLLNYFLLLGSDWPSPTQDPLLKSIPDKSILIIGGGSAGLSVLKTLLDLPKEIRGNWEISLYEQRHDIGGIWQVAQASID
jgi:heterodisulfide reductase subunit A-like polyferredoxin